MKQTKQENKIIVKTLGSLLSGDNQKNRRDDREFWLRLAEHNGLRWPTEVVKYESTEYMRRKDAEFISTPDRIECHYEACIGEGHRVMMKHDCLGYLVGARFLPHVPADLLYEKLYEIFGDSEQKNIGKIPNGHKMIEFFSALTESKKKVDVYISVFAEICRMNTKEISDFYSKRLKEITDGRYRESIRVGFDFD